MNCGCACHQTNTQHHDGKRCYNPFDCPGPCHDGEFDHFCDALNVRDDELPHAFAAWLGRRAGWAGEYKPMGGAKQ